jgi:hypothetical protein
MRHPDRGRLDGTRCRSGPTWPLNPGPQSRQRGKGTWVPHARSQAARADRSKTGRLATEQRSIPSDAMPSRTTQEIELVMAIATMIISQYLHGNPGWDGPQTVAALRDVVSRLS